MPDLLKNNIILMYLFILIFFLKPEKLKENHKIFIVYLCGFFIDCMNTIQTLYILVLTIISLFLYIEYFNDSVFKRDVMIKMRYKFLDFFYIMFFQYYFGYYLCVMFLNTQFVKNLEFLKVIDDKVITCLNFIFLLHIADLLYSLNWQIKSLDEMKRIMDEIILIYNLDVNVVKKKERLVIRLEDKSFLKRKKYTTFFSFDYLINYGIPRIIKYVMKRIHMYKNINIVNLFKDINRIKKLLLKKIISLFSGIRHLIKRIFFALIRGHSTIEAQIIRTIGIEKGYHSKPMLIFKRKIFEIIYTKIFFVSLNEYYKYNLYANVENMKEYLLYIYLLTSKIVIKGKSFNGIKSMYKKELNQITDDELFIAVLSMSKYNMDEEEIYNQAKIYGYKLTLDRIKKILNKIV